MKSIKACLMALACFYLVLCSICAADETRVVVDSRGVSIAIPEEINRVVSVSDALIESVMFVLGVEEKLVGVGSPCFKQFLNFSIPIGINGTYECLGGMTPVAFLSPRIRELPQVWNIGAGLNFETLVNLDPDLVILRVGDCEFKSMDDEGVQKTIRTIEGLGIPVIVLEGPPCFDEPDISTISDEIRILGNVFGKEETSEELSNYIESQTQLVFDRTKDIPEAERPNVIIFGAPGTSKQSGGAGSVKGTDTIESYFTERIVHAKNAYRNTGYPIISAEQLLAINPDVIVLCTWNGYHPPDELYSAPYFQNVGELSAIKNRRVMSLPFLCGNIKSLEYPIDVMVIAQAAYPERFNDIDLAEWLLEFYQKVYGIDRATAEGLRSAQFMDWCVEGWTPTKGSRLEGNSSYQWTP